MSDCTNLYFLSAVSCQLSECLSLDELERLKSDLLVLGYMLENITARKDGCKNTSCTSPFITV